MQTLLKNMLGKHAEMAFPRVTNNDKMRHWLAELAYTEGYYVGLGQSLIAGHSIYQIDCDPLRKLRQQLNSLHRMENTDQIAMAEYERYLASLEKLVAHMSQSLKLSLSLSG